MIKIIDGDLFDSKAKFICHQVNCQGRMGSGVALQVRQKYPHVFEEYKKICSSNMLGNIQCVPINSEYIGYDSGSLVVPYTEQYICNLFAQDNYGYDGKLYTSLEALESCFQKISTKTFERNNNYGAIIAMPYMIGCCRGGANWETVYSMIERIFKYQTVEIWRYNKD